MMKNIALIILLVLVYVNANAGLAFNQPINVCSFDNIEYAGNSLMTSEGNRFIMWKEEINGSFGWKCNLFNTQNQALWAEDKVLPISMYNHFKLIETSDHCIVIGYSNGIKLLKIDQLGNFLWGEQGVSVAVNTAYGSFGTLVADLEGGVYLTKERRDLNDSFFYLQHLNAVGNLTMTSVGIRLSNETAYNPGLLVLQDNSLVVNWREANRIVTQRVSSAGQRLWEQDLVIQKQNWYPWVKTCAFIDGSFALCAVASDSIYVYRYSASGVPQWGSPVADFLSFSFSVSFPVVDMSLSSDNCLLIHVHNSDTCYDDYIQKIDANGVKLFPSGVAFGTGLSSTYSMTQINPDNSGGCRIGILCPGSITADKNVMVAELNSLGEISYHQISYDQSKKGKLSATMYGSDLYLEWQQSTVGEQGMYAQRIDDNYQSYFPGNGIPLRYGTAGFIEYQCNASMGNGCAVLWHQALSDNGTVEARLQLFNRAGEELCAHGGVVVNSTGSTIPVEGRLLYRDGELLMIWEELMGSVYSLRAQIFNDDGTSVYPEGGLELYSGNIGHNSLSINYYDGDWYILACFNDSVWGQKLSGHVAVWGNGLQLTSPYPGLTGTLYSAYLSFPWLVWKVGFKELFKQIDTNGVTIAPWQDCGMQPPSDGWNSGRVTPLGDYLHLFATTSASNPNTPPDFRNLFINSQGEYTLGESMSYLEDIQVMEYDGDVLIADNINGLTIRRYNHDGSLLDSGHTNVDYPYGSFIKWDKMTNGNLLCYYYYNYSIGRTLKYIFITPQLEAETNQPGIVLDNGTSEQPSISTYNDQNWITWVLRPIDMNQSYDNSYSEIQLQGILGNSSGVLEQDEPLPTIQNTLKCSPNPFNPQTSINYEVQKGGVTKLEVYDIKGRKVKTLVNESRSPGSYSVAWDGTDERLNKLASGVYILRYKDSTGTETRRLSILK